MGAESAEIEADGKSLIYDLYNAEEADLHDAVFAGKQNENGIDKTLINELKKLSPMERQDCLQCKKIDVLNLLTSYSDDIMCSGCIRTLREAINTDLSDFCATFPNEDLDSFGMASGQIMRPSKAQPKDMKADLAAKQRAESGRMKQVKGFDFAEYENFEDFIDKDGEEALKKLNYSVAGVKALRPQSTLADSQLMEVGTEPLNVSNQVGDLNRLPAPQHKSQRPGILSTAKPSAEGVPRNSHLFELQHLKQSSKKKRRSKSKKGFCRFSAIQKILKTFIIEINNSYLIPGIYWVSHDQVEFPFTAPRSKSPQKHLTDHQAEDQLDYKQQILKQTKYTSKYLKKQKINADTFFNYCELLKDDCSLNEKEQKYLTKNVEVIPEAAEFLIRRNMDEKLVKFLMKKKPRNQGLKAAMMNNDPARLLDQIQRRFNIDLSQIMKHPDFPQFKKWLHEASHSTNGTDSNSMLSLATMGRLQDYISINKDKIVNGHLQAILPLRLKDASKTEGSKNSANVISEEETFKVFGRIFHLFNDASFFSVNSTTRKLKRNKQKRKRCHLHLSQPKLEVNWLNVWFGLDDERKREISQISVDDLISGLNKHLKQLFFCRDCRCNVRRAMEMLIDKSMRPSALSNNQGQIGDSVSTSASNGHSTGNHQERCESCLKPKKLGEKQKQKKAMKYADIANMKINCEAFDRLKARFSELGCNLNEEFNNFSEDLYKPFQLEYDYEEEEEEEEEELSDLEPERVSPELEDIKYTESVNSIEEPPELVELTNSVEGEKGSGKVNFDYDAFKSRFYEKLRSDKTFQVVSGETPEKLHEQVRQAAEECFNDYVNQCLKEANFKNKKSGEDSEPPKEVPQASVEEKSLTSINTMEDIVELERSGNISEASAKKFQDFTAERDIFLREFIRRVVSEDNIKRILQGESQIALLAATDEGEETRAEEQLQVKHSCDAHCEDYNCECHSYPGASTASDDESSCESERPPTHVICCVEGVPHLIKRAIEGDQRDELTKAKGANADRHAPTLRDGQQEVLHCIGSVMLTRVKDYHVEHLIQSQTNELFLWLILRVMRTNVQRKVQEKYSAEKERELLQLLGEEDAGSMQGTKKSTKKKKRKQRKKKKETDKLDPEVEASSPALLSAVPDASLLHAVAVADHEPDANGLGGISGWTEAKEETLLKQMGWLESSMMSQNVRKEEVVLPKRVNWEEEEEDRIRVETKGDEDSAALPLTAEELDEAKLHLKRMMKKGKKSRQKFREDLKKNFQNLCGVSK